MVPGNRRETEGAPESGSFPESVTHLQAVLQYLDNQLRDTSYDPRQNVPASFPNPYGMRGGAIDVFQNYARVARVQTDALPPAQEVTKIQIENQVLNRVQPMLDRLQRRIQELESSAFSFDTMDLGADAWGLQIDEESQYDDEKLQFVRATYDILRTQYSPIEYRLPEWEQFRELPGSEALDLLTMAIMNKISAVYDDAAASGGTEKTIPGKSVDLWDDEDLFKEITLHGTEDKSLKFFMTQFPWEMFLPADTRTEARVFAVRSEMSNLWKYRLICLANMGNRAHDIEEMWRKNAHGTFKDDILDYFAGLGDGGGYMQWDMPNYHKRHHTGILAEVFGDGEAAPGQVVEEQSWLTAEYTNFFMHSIEQGNSNLSFAMPTTVSEVISSKQKYIKALRKRLIARYGDEDGEERFKRDKTKIEIAWNVAFWTIIHTLVLIDFDDDGLHTKLGRVVNNKAYAPKILVETANAKDRVRSTIAQQIESAMVTRDRFIHTTILLQTREGDDIFEPHDLDFRVKDPKELKLSPYEKYVKQLVRQSVGRFEQIVINDPSSSCIRTLQAEAQAIRRERDSLADFATGTSQSAQLEALEKDIDAQNILRGDLPGIKQQKIKERNKLIAKRRELILRQDLNRELEYLNGLIAALNAPLSGESLLHTAYRYAVTQRYDVILVKPQYRNIGADQEVPAENTEEARKLEAILNALPIAIPKQLFKVDDGRRRKNDGSVEIVPPEERIYDGRKYAVVPMQAIRDGLIDTQFVDFAAMTKEHQYRYAAAMADLRHWYDFGDLTKTDAIFRDIHSSDLTAKLMAKVKLLHWPGKWKEFKFKAWSKLPWADIERLAEQADEAFRSKVAVSKISIDEIAVGDGAKGADNTIRGIGFHKITQYAGRYAAGKMKASGASIPASREEYESGKYSLHEDLPTIWLEVFRAQVDDFDGLVEEASQMSESAAKKHLRKEMATPVPPNVRFATDEFFAGRTGRWEKQMIVEAFWVALGAYLDQYAYKPLKDDQGRDFNLAFMEVDTLIPHIKTQSGAKPMSFAERQLLIHFVDKQLAYFSGDKYAVGDEVPMDVGTRGDVIEMMKQRGIIGSTQQFLVDLHYLEHDFKNLKTVKKKE